MDFASERKFFEEFQAMVIGQKGSGSGSTFRASPVYRYPWAVKNRAAAGPLGHGANGSKPFGLTAFGEGAVTVLCL